MTCELIQLLDNTFIGTFSAGILLGLFGLVLYRFQKKADLEFDTLQKTRTLASNLYAKTDLAAKRYEAQIKLYDGTVPTLAKLSVILNERTNNHFKKEFDKDFNLLTEEITEAADDLVSDLKINKKFPQEIELIGKNVPLLNFFLLGVSVAHMSSPEDLKILKNSFDDAVKPLISSLQRIIEQ